MGAFSDAVYEVVRRIPLGSVATYGQVARLMGRPQSARYVGFALRNNPAPLTGPSRSSGAHAKRETNATASAHAAMNPVPCHRVLFKDGSLVPGFAFGGPDEQRRLLEAEGVPFLLDGRVNLAACQWDGCSDAASSHSHC